MVEMSETTFETLHLSKTPDRIMVGAEPIFIDQGETAFLFLHGFTGSPYEGRSFAEHFARKGYAVWVPLLPGHGTAPEDMENMPYQAWLKAAEDYYGKIKAQYKRIIVCGQSMGGALALHLAARFPVDGVISLAGAIFIKNWRLYLLPFTKHLIRYQYKPNGPDIRNKMAKVKSASYYKYPTKSITQFLKLIHLVKSELPQVKSPCLLIHSQKDHTVTYKNLDYIFQHVSSKKRRKLTLKNSYHIISEDEEKIEIFEAIENFMQEIYLDENHRNP